MTGADPRDTGDRFDIHVNGESRSVPAGSSLADLVATVLEGRPPRGVAVAVDRSVVPRSAWADTPVLADSLVEVVEAAAGG